MATVNDKELEDLLGKCSAWLPKAMEQVGCTAPVDVTSAACKRAMKDTLGLLFSLCALTGGKNETAEG